jgi:hypothetical protein
MKKVWTQKCKLCGEVREGNQDSVCGCQGGK